ncbi:putative signal-transduction protein with CBS domains [Pyrobaculum islandicum DSM 4184]|uniref:Signal-transduction protein with CBS domains n=1 Tax=Pyrobaculum islandicum (strain DSM 4184 / JCM 9189 / GEO3) TaxID=384616 RepID=A1RUW9_PYRIL|nr:CBS domain-containing protein [Pyrobaculum islandicum]ABL88751.1 putative signal-transduction protein with CBS domains [Pyrobaculum islandicum DSM 4184]
MLGSFAKTDVIKAFPSTSIREVAKLMAQRKVGLVVLVDPSDPYRVVGVVSERDIVRAVAHEIDLDMPCETIASKNVISLEANENVAKAAEAFVKYGIRHLVVTKDGRLYGVFSIRDLIKEENALKELAEYYDWTFEPGMST